MTYVFSSSFIGAAGYSPMYYSNSDTAKTAVDSWYESNIIDKGYDSYVVTGNFCEQAKIKQFSNYYGDSAVLFLYTTYTPNFKCTADGNGRGIINSKVGLITYDEIVYAGGYVGNNSSGNSSYYLYNGYGFISMSPAGYNPSHAHYLWFVDAPGNVWGEGVYYYSYSLRPVINVNANVTATGTGTEIDPYVIVTN